MEPYPPGYDRDKRNKRLRRTDHDKQGKDVSATPNEPIETSPNKTISNPDMPNAVGTLENAKMLAKLRCYTCIYKKYTLEEWKKFANENRSFHLQVRNQGKLYYTEIFF